MSDAPCKMCKMRYVLITNMAYLYCMVNKYAIR